MLRRPSLFFAVLLLSALPAFSQDERPVPVTVCELQAHPDSYNHKLIEVQGRVSHEFEDFTLRDDECPASRSGVWLTYGGDAPDEVMFCCNGTGRSRRNSLQIEGIDTYLTKDDLFQRFRRLLNSYRHPKHAKVVYFQKDPSYVVVARLVARFFAGKANVVGQRGFGHMGCCALLAIQRVASIESVTSNVRPGDMDCYSEGWHDNHEYGALVAMHNELMNSNEKWRTNDAQRVADEALGNYLKDSGMKDVRLGNRSCKTKHLTYQNDKNDQYSFTCSWTAGAEDAYTVELLKFYFLKTTLNTWKDIAWMPYEITHQHCSEGPAIGPR